MGWTCQKIQKRMRWDPLYKRKNIVDNLIGRAYNNNH